MAVSLHRKDFTAKEFYDLCDDGKRREIHECLGTVDVTTAVVTLAYALANAVVVMCKDDLAAAQSFDVLSPIIRDQIMQMANDPDWLEELKEHAN
jgi:hypothetical protein